MHLDTPLIPLTKIKNNENSDKDCVKIKLRRNPPTQKLDLYQFKMIFFDNGYPEDFLLFIRNFNMAHEASGTILSGLKIQYLCTMVHGEALRQFDTFSDEVVINPSKNLKSIILVLGTYVFPVSTISKQKCAIHRGMRNRRSLKIRLYAACMIDINNYLDVFPRERASDKNL